ncbi:MAG: helix-turn-helix domain-containing protein [Pseudomonadota bacterium]|nr:helix-turn-helix domain-containing protein [Pseudomonadota bacterium]
MSAPATRERAAHLLCEIHCRLDALGEVHDGSVVWPMTQTDLGNALGMSVVHVNRTLKELRQSGLIALDRGVLRIPDLAALMYAGDFDAGYLHMRTAAERAMMV